MSWVSAHKGTYTAQNFWVSTLGDNRFFFPFKFCGDIIFWAVSENMDMEGIQKTH